MIPESSPTRRPIRSGQVVLLVGLIGFAVLGFIETIVLITLLTTGQLG